MALSEFPKSSYLVDIHNNSAPLEEFNKDFTRIAPLVMQYHETAPDRDLVSRQIREFYFGGKEIDGSTKSEMTNMFTDAWFLLAQDGAVRLHFKANSKPIYYFLFGYRGTFTFGGLFGNATEDYGVCHVDELLYLFNLGDVFPGYKPSEKDREMMDAMTTMWANFAKTGNPTPNEDLPAKWTPIKSDKLEYLYIKSRKNMEMEEDIYGDRVKLWRTLPIDSKGIKLAVKICMGDTVMVVLSLSLLY